MSDSEDPKKQDTFEREYAALKAHGKPLAFSSDSLANSDRIITQYLSRTFNGSSAIQTNHLGRKSFFGGLEPIDIEARKIEQNATNLADFNSEEALDHKADKLHTLQRLISAAPSLKGLTPAVAQKIENHTVNDKDLRAAFPNADLNIVKAAAYTLLNATQERLPNGKPDQHLQDMSITHLHYAQESDKAYDAWSAGKQAEIARAMTGSNSLMSDLKQLRCPQNISTTAELEEQFTLRQRIARTMTDIYAKTYDVQDTLSGADDTHVIYKSRADIVQNPALAYASANLPGVVNDETIIYRYNPAAQLTLQNSSLFTQTDKAEALLFVDSMAEELQHTVDNINADNAVLGQKAQSPALEQHNIAFTLNRLYYQSPTQEFPKNASESLRYGQQADKYAAQYIESTAKISAANVSAAVMKSYDAPLPPKPVAPIEEKSVLDTTLDTLKRLNPFK